ncbi:2463_t:CDS:2 [Funneliformis caledonium]|uniref:2463_t:CDS:1 n=1 Tax=Funneliformis caledonium TaxID=1117310 RepID=A0A9N8W0S3_9GLOM|nr:2463_t:CDS:2 [Funneliformis caledonium]
MENQDDNATIIQDEEDFQEDDEIRDDDTDSDIQEKLIISRSIRSKQKGISKSTVCEHFDLNNNHPT